MWYLIWYHKWWCLFASRIAWWFSYPTLTIQTWYNLPTSRQTLTFRGMAWYGMRVLNSSSTVHCALQAPRGAAVRTMGCPWCISARLSLFIWPPAVSCSELAWPCCMTLPATHGCPASTSAQWQTSWDEHPWFHASLAATSTPLFRIPSRTIGVLEVPQLTRSEIGATTADFTRWTFGRGATAGGAPGWCQLLRLKESGASLSARAGSGQLRQGSWAANRPGLGLPVAAQNEQTVYDIMYDINVCSCMISYPTQMLWYHDMNAMISYTKSNNIKCTSNLYDFITKGMISYMITDMISSFYFIWYWV